ncbi:RNA-binding S4 domain-containing protein [Brumimicrobium glaciale]|jgi:ribosome-associated heat shock protein Hsp15|uniref:RNA-binding S4 domain-containing protein n=1 Tax=Brumimicrobium glaciale TaxID=200475 RepID=A0A4Q4KJJ7_9FLAO|nr:RNA-binding S4 domain-containing protein [Brumimicrobium glaciale]RYM32444.1 RNA-binding S4 domain-containing protein [Brumimicrobium glaciale]
MSVRIDKFIWFTRLCKTRSIATELVKKGKVKLNGEGIKPAREVKVGDVIGIVKHTSLFTYKIKSLLKNRVGAKLVEDHLIDVTPLEEIEKFKAYQSAQSAYRGHGTGKPTKKERRVLDSFLHWDDEDEDDV